MTRWCSMHPSVFQGSHLPQGWVFAEKERLHGPVLRKCRPLRLRPQPGCLGGPSDHSCLCAGDGVAAGHLSLALTCSGGNEPKGLGFQGTLQPGSDNRAVQGQEVCAELWHTWLWPVSFL